MVCDKVKSEPSHSFIQSCQFIGPDDASFFVLCLNSLLCAVECNVMCSVSHLIIKILTTISRSCSCHHPRPALLSVSSTIASRQLVVHTKTRNFNQLYLQRFKSYTYFLGTFHYRCNLESILSINQS